MPPLQTSSRPSSGYIPTLDGWRAIAIFMVLFGHAPGIPHGPVLDRLVGAGGLGVDLFFAISGVLICSRLLEEDRAFGHISLRGFYTRRAFRIFPASFLYLAVIALIYLFHLAPHDWQAWGSAVFFVRNYFSVFIRESLNGRFTSHFWSLAIEEHFYLILPAALVVFPRRRKLVLGGLTLSAFAWLTTYLLITPTLARQAEWERRTDLRLQSLLFPAFLALLMAVPAIRTRFQRYVTPRNLGIALAIVFFAGLAKHFLIAPAPPAVLVPDAAHPGQFLAPVETRAPLGPLYVVPLLFPFLILATMLHPTALVSRLLELKLLRAIGRISYSLYLWQQLFWTAVAYPGWPVHYVQYPALGFVLAFAAATASYFLIEKPAIRLGHRLFPPPTPGHRDLRPSP